jgi:ubiquitin-protein ligase E3 A
LNYSDRAPIEGLEKLNLVISKNGSEDGRLPSAHTCFNHLLLPDYSSIEIMKERINYAMRQAEGFGLR